MKNLRNKIATIAISIFLIVSMTASLTLIPSASAHNPAWTIADHAYISLAPNPVGIGQTVTISIWTAQPVPNAAVINNIRKENYKLTITAPDGANTTQSWPVVPNTGGELSTTFVPSAAGTYTATFTFAGMTYPTSAQVIWTAPATAAQIASVNAYAGDIFSPDTTSTTFTVQQQPLGTIPATPLPTAYWTFPINGQNAEWYTIASNWLDTSSGAPGQLGSTAESGYSIFQNSGTAPNSGHILWTYPMEFGGTVGGTNTGVLGASYYSGSSYQPRFINAIIENGYLFFKMPYGGGGSTTVTGFDGNLYGGAYECLNLRTGQIVWKNNNPAFNPTFGQLFNEIDPNQSGIIPSGYLWQSFTLPTPTAIPAVTGQEAPATMSSVTWIAYSATTGDWQFNITNVPQSYSVYGKNGQLLQEQTTIQAMDSIGSLLIYVLDYNTATQSGWLALWNSTTLIYNLGASGVGHPYRPEAFVIDGSAHAVYGSTPATPYMTAYIWNVSLNANLNGLVLNTTAASGVSIGGPTINAVIPGDIMMGTSSGLSEAVGPQFTPNPFTMWAINLNSSRGAVGSTLWVKNYAAPQIMTDNSNLGSYAQRIVDIDPTTRVITMMIGETMEWLGYSLDTGTLLWGPTTTVFSQGYQYFGSGLGIGQNAADAYGKIYVEGYGGEIWCYDTSNGNLLWQFGNGGPGNSTNDGLNSPWGLLPTLLSCIADGKVYFDTNQHGNGAQSPYYKGETLYCVNATTGKLIWQEQFQGGDNGGPGYPIGVVASGEYVNYNMYDNQVYAFGQGPSKTTVTAPEIGVTTATPITIAGSVIDISAGTTQTQQAADFPNGLPCVSDASMTQWMEYVYMQQPEPTNITGVPVTLSVLDANGNYRTIGTTTTDASGTFSYTWTPDIPGVYTLYATFAGSNSYYGSSAEAHFYASTTGPTTAPTATPLTGLASNTTLMYGVAAIIIVIIIIGAAILFVLNRKRP
ncbi:MAG: PQQ-binding-like beta-propeller repeat protein [Candidatus Bathyarchaeia archaeon]